MTTETTNPWCDWMEEFWPGAVKNVAKTALAEATLRMALRDGELDGARLMEIARSNTPLSSVLISETLWDLVGQGVIELTDRCRFRLR